MKPNREQIERTANSQQGFAVIGVLALIGVLGGGHMLMMRSGPRPPASSEFGLGPRVSASGIYTATLQPDAPLRPRKMLTVSVRLTDRNGQPVDHAEIAVDGGMPQHRHGLPTRPRVTGAAGNGTYTIEGVRFNMGGWWEFRLKITAAAGTDIVTFNLKL